MTNRSYRTAKGTELPLLNLRGKQYLEVKFRLVWFREDHPDWSIETELQSVTEVSAYARATIRDEKGRIIATSHKFENVQGFPDFIEKAETGAIGRALALIGYGTQFCADELDEGNRIVDAPVDRQPNYAHITQPVPVAAKPPAAPPAEEEETMPTDPGEYLLNFGRRFKGRKLKDIPRKELDSYLQWLETNAVREGSVLSQQVRMLKDAYGRLYGETETQGPSAH